MTKSTFIFIGMLMLTACSNFGKKKSISYLDSFEIYSNNAIHSINQIKARELYVISDSFLVLCAKENIKELEIKHRTDTTDSYLMNTKSIKLLNDAIEKQKRDKEYLAKMPK